jgi:hypothetical protein
MGAHLGKSALPHRSSEPHRRFLWRLATNVKMH